MCGITGIVALQSASPQLGYWAKMMSDVLKHRGPDGAGYALFERGKTPLAAGDADTPEASWKCALPWKVQQSIESVQGPKHLALGHRRLSILDLSPGGHQPLCSPDRSIWLTFNGEIYNYLELQQALPGATFETHSDTEVLLRAWQRWGPDCLSRLNGMWSFAIYDASSGMLWCSRDRTGVKPFYYYSNEAYFAFASEQKALLQLPFVEKKLNTRAAADLMVLNKIETEAESLFSGIFELLPGHLLALNTHTGQFSIQKWFNPPTSAPFESFSKKQNDAYAAEVQHALSESIRLRLRSDVPVGACLSGGMDSSAIVCLMRRHLQKENINVFTAASEVPELDESHWARQIAEHTQANMYVVTPTADELLRDFEKLTYCQDLPTLSSRTYAQYRVMQLIHQQNVKVVLDGQGGDELFSGYTPHSAGYWMELLGHFRWGTLLKEWKDFGGTGKGAQFMAKLWAKYNGVHFMPNILKNNILKKKRNEWRYLNPELVELALQRLPLQVEERLDTLGGMLEFEYFGHPLKHLLRCEDRCGMAHSVESRTPFADDPALMQLVFSIPSSYKINGGFRKAVLRESMKGIVPEAVRLRRDKMGFVTPNNAWLGKMSAGLKDYVEQDNSGVFNKKAILEDYGRFFAPPTNQEENFRVYKFLAFAVWNKLFLNQPI